jgi:predicted RNA binding protein YcfA (HicA-like mRNA interferase family)
VKGYYTEICLNLKSNGWIHKRTNGSHEIWQKDGRSVTVPKSSKSRHTANAVMKQAGIERKFE